MERCKTCAYWKQNLGSVLTNGVRGGGCSNEKLREAWGGGGYEADALVYSYDEGGSFWTGPEFGCVHHKAAE